MQIYISSHGERVGPYSLEEINRRLASGTLYASDLGWSESSPGWKPLASFAGVIMPGGASSTPIPIGIATPHSSSSRKYAGFWIRTLAGLMDGAIVAAVLWGAAMLVERSTAEAGRFYLFGIGLLLALGVAYMPACWISPMQATIGQKVCRLKVIPVFGGRVSPGQAILRMLALMLSAVLLGIGIFMIAFNDAKRGLHDMIADTAVVKVGS
jgi:uncharacterized RDD family membrane protein YckC